MQDPEPITPTNDEENDWGSAMPARWAEELDDPREDIYTAEDGTPYQRR
jgi:hypothetical protein